MSYQVIARKWRPQTFAEIVEQQHVTRTLQNAIHEEAIKHTEGAGRDVFGAAATRPLIIGHGRRRILHFNVTSHPTAGDSVVAQSASTTAVCSPPRIPPCRG